MNALKLIICIAGLLAASFSIPTWQGAVILFLTLVVASTGLDWNDIQER